MSGVLDGSHAVRISVHPAWRQQSPFGIDTALFRGSCLPLSTKGTGNHKQSLSGGSAEGRVPHDAAYKIDSQQSSDSAGSRHSRICHAPGLLRISSIALGAWDKLIRECTA